MERFLMIWIHDQTSRHVPLSQGIIQNKAQSLFYEMKAKKGEAGKDADFGASREWLDRFKRRFNLYINVQGQAAAADTVAAESFPRNLAKIIEDGGYSKDQIFNEDETGMFGKKMPSRTLIAKRKSMCQDLKQLRIG
jgi:hypothetical protein